MGVAIMRLSGWIGATDRNRGRRKEDGGRARESERERETQRERERERGKEGGQRALVFLDS